ncbi:hypothetical protein BS059_RS22490 [Vibrio parahaemolyticus]|nr:hypothetical protein [Vibrio parahaemolyticus]
MKNITNCQSKFFTYILGILLPVTPMLFTKEISKIRLIFTKMDLKFWIIFFSYSIGFCYLTSIPSEGNFGLQAYQTIGLFLMIGFFAASSEFMPMLKFIDSKEKQETICLPDLRKDKS